MASRLLSHVNKRARIGAKGRTFSLEMSGSTDRMSEMKSTFSFSNSRATSSVNFSCGSNKQADQATERVALRLDHVTNPLRVGLIPIPQHADEQGRGKREREGGGGGEREERETEREKEGREGETGRHREGRERERDIHRHRQTDTDRGKHTRSLTYLAQVQSFATAKTGMEGRRVHAHKLFLGKQLRQHHNVGSRC